MAQWLPDDVDFGMGQLKWLDVGQMVAELISSLALPYVYHQDNFHSIALARPPNAIITRRQGQFSSSHALKDQLTCTYPSRANSTVLPDLVVGPTLPRPHIF